MRTLKEFIFERFDLTKLENVKITYDIYPEELYIEAPENYSESDMQIYLGDKFLDNLPSGKSNSTRLFGKNAQYIDDAYFEYDKFEHMKDSDKDVDIAWDKQYDTSKAEKKTDTFKVTKMRYVILFSDFEIYVENEDKIDETIEKIFRATDSDKVNDFNIKITYNPELTEYDKINK